jgi:tetratricopeptide (TPR) repeat protein
VSNEREKILQSAQRHVDKRRFDKAIEEYQKIVQRDPNDARTLLKIGDLQARMQAYAEAIATYDRVGHYYAEQGFALKAIAVYKQIRELIRKHAPELADRYGHIVPRLADIYTQLGLTSDALAAYDEVATRLQRGGRDRDAIEIFRKMVVLDATNPLPHLRLAEACCRVQSLDEAIDSFWAAAELLLKLQRRDDALKVIERILHFRQDAKYAKVAAELYLEKSNREAGMQALQRLQICFQADPKNLETLELLAQAFTTIGQETKSIEVYKEMARIAREQGRDELFEKLVEHLQRVAPGDEQVEALANLPPSTAHPTQQSQTSAVSIDADVELIEEAPELTIEEAPFELQHQAARAPMTSGPEVVVDEGFEGAEEYGSVESFDAEGHARKAVIDAESFRKLRLYSKAIETLRIALEIDPGSIDIREKLREILSEAGDRDGAIGEGITLAAMLLDIGDGERAEMLLYDVLDMEPEHPAALEMLEQLSNGHAGHAAQARAFEEAGYPRQGYDPSAPLPSYDLEEVGPSQALAAGHPEQERQRPDDIAQPEPDDPFATAALDAPFGEEGPLPSFPLGGEEDDLMAGLDEPEATDSGPLPSFERDEEGTTLHGEPAFAEPAFAEPEYVEPDYIEPEDAEPEYAEPEYAEPEYAEPEYIEPEYADAGPSAAAGTDYTAHTLGSAPDTEIPAAGPEPSEAIEEVLEEADFFASRGLYDDAKAILTDQLSRTPKHPLVLERLQDVEQALAGAGESRTIERSQLGATTSEPVEEDHAFDIAASLDALDALDDLEVSNIQPEARSFANAEQEVDVDQVFAKFKEGVRAQVSESDSSTHYDLGVAYKEMGLLADAVNEFELAARDSTRECMCFAMVGMIHLEQNALDKAAEAYIRGLDAKVKTVEQEMSLYYDLGNVYEMKNSDEEAIYYFKKIARRDPGYRDVKDRIAALEPDQAPAPAAARAVNDDDEFDRVFDDLFDTK